MQQVSLVDVLDLAVSFDRCAACYCISRQLTAEYCTRL